mmetsp:Transcript_32943/g.75005  ORF Transcript_32943/g.75005 Transcript_32943/m.75005 type:complete len:292 (+) Transcript_32943:281-1156(+)
MARDRGRNVRTMRADVILLTKAARLKPFERMWRGKTSAAKIHVMGPMPTEKKAMNSQTAEDASQPCSCASAMERTNWHAAMPKMLMRSNGRRPTLSSRNAETTMKNTFTTPTMMVTAKSAECVCATPAPLNISGEYRTMLSDPLICCAQATPMPTKSMRLVTLSGFKMGAQPSQPWLSLSLSSCSWLLILDTISEVSTPAACVRARTSCAWAVRPLATSHLGDSGMTVRDNTKRAMGRAAPHASITRQFWPSGRPAKAQFATKPNRTPRLTAISAHAVSIPRYSAGATSAM